VWLRNFGRAYKKTQLESVLRSLGRGTIFSEFEPGSFAHLVSSAASPHSLHSCHCKMVRSFA
jgi:hypothetical protein